MKKVLLVFVMMIIGFFAVACKESGEITDTRVTLLDLVGKTEQEIDALYEDIDLDYTFVYVTSQTVEAGKFIRYRGGYTAGNKVDRKSVV